MVGRTYIYLTLVPNLDCELFFPPSNHISEELRGSGADRDSAEHLIYMPRF